MIFYSLSIVGELANIHQPNHSPNPREASLLEWWPCWATSAVYPVGSSSLIHGGAFPASEPSRPLAVVRPTR